MQNAKAANMNPTAFLPTFVFETVGLSMAVAVGFWDGSNYYEWMRTDEKSNPVWEFLAFLRTNYGENDKFNGLKLYGHRAANIENRLIFHELESRDEIMAFMPTYQSLTWVGPNVRFDDSSLHIKKPDKYLKDKGVEPYVESFDPAPSGEKLTVFRHQMKLDVMNLSKALTQWYCDWYTSFGVKISTTYNTTTMAALRKNFCTADFDMCTKATQFNLRRDTETFVRKATYGMRNEVYCRHAPNGKYDHGDIHSFFPSCYDTDIPIGRIDWNAADLDDPLAAAAEVSVYIPEDLYIGPLPYHDPERGLIFPVGYIPKTWYDVKELKNAVEKFDVQVLRVHRQLNCEKWSPMLRGFGIAMAENTIFPKSNRKLIAIGPSGKMGQHRWRTEVKHWSQMKDVEFKSFVPIGENETYLEIMTFNESAYIMPAVTMRVRAEGRMRHLDKLMEAHRNGKIFYCDSDSIFCTAGAVKAVEADKAKTGDLILVDEFVRGYFIRQKLYGVVTADGTLLQRSAGYSDVKLSEEDFKKLLNDETVLDVEVKSLSSLKQQLTRRELELFDRHIHVKGSLPASRVAVGDDTKPIYLEETECE